MKAGLQERTRQFVQKNETAHLVTLADHVQNLRILLQRAKDGCDCPQHRSATLVAEEKLEKAKNKYQAERDRLYGRHEDPETLAVDFK